MLGTEMLLKLNLSQEKHSNLSRIRQSRGQENLESCMVDAAIAQLVEQLPCKHQVVGSMGTLEQKPIIFKRYINYEI